MTETAPNNPQTDKADADKPTTDSHNSPIDTNQLAASSDEPTPNTQAKQTSCSHHSSTSFAVAQALLQIRAVFLRPQEPFTWASGIQSPIYCDNRLILTAPKQRTLIEDSLASLIKEKFPETELLMGTATAGIAHAALAAERLDLPMGYVRSGAKVHGRGRQIEGEYHAGQKVVVVEDLISTGGSSIEAAQALTEAGLSVVAIVAVFSYGMQKAAQKMQEAGFTYTSLTTLDVLVQAATANNYISAAEGQQVLQFRDNPADWAKAMGFEK